MKITKNNNIKNLATSIIVTGLFMIAAVLWENRGRFSEGDCVKGVHYDLKIEKENIFTYQVTFSIKGKTFRSNIKKKIADRLFTKGVCNEINI